jgi:mannose-1-phosphate guanylyltransferase
MILAAGFGTRLKPLTLTKPKALVEVNGNPMIKIVLNKLIDYGIKEVVINTHHFAELVEKYVNENGFPARIHFSREPEILGTGGGIKAAARFLRSAKDFLVHNVDIISDIDVSELYGFHETNKPLASLAVQFRRTSRPLLIDGKNCIVGRVSGGRKIKCIPGVNPDREIAFCGIHILSSRIFDYFPEEKSFDIFAVYFDAIKAGEKVLGWDAGRAKWKDAGKFDKSYR